MKVERFRVRRVRGVVVRRGRGGVEVHEGVHGVEAVHFPRGGQHGLGDRGEVGVPPLVRDVARVQVAVVENT